jgi:hypothetical protein
VRPWLVVIGTALLLVGAGIFALLLALPPTSQTTITTFQGDIGGSDGVSIPLWIHNTSQGKLQLSWSSDAPLSVDLYHPDYCPQFPSCSLGDPLVSWTSEVSESWSMSGPLTFPYLLNLSNSGGTPVSFHVAFTENYTVHSGVIPPVTELFIYTGGAILIVIGALGVFLGLFLRGGVYQGPAPVTPRTAEDIDQLYPSGPPPEDDDIP